MNEQEFGFETQAIRNQLERTQYLEHLCRYLTSSFVFEDAEDACFICRGKDRNIYSRYSNPNNNEFISKVCAMEVLQLVLPFIRYGSGVFHLAFIEFEITLFLRAVFLPHTVVY
jgi:O-acetylhomoserine/O-acetylserine sulfhydrylase-like pyridoxal-dependent enzyme